MAGIHDQITHPLLGSEEQISRPRPPPSRRRDKPQLSCVSCRRRKLRCDRQQPCSNCSKRGTDRTCAYVSHSPRPETETTNMPKLSTQDRLCKLENLVVSLMNHSDKASNVASGSSSSVDDTVEEDFAGGPDLGSLSLSDSGPRYRDNSHWITVMREIAELKDDISGECRDGVETQHSTAYNVGLLYGCRQATKQELLAAVPHRAEADRLISQYFVITHSAACMLHKYEFFKQYEAFWLDPQRTPIIWVGMLFSMFCLAAQFQYHEFDYPDPSELRQTESEVPAQTKIRHAMDNWREKTVQCLVLGQYARGGPHVIEALIHYTAAEFTWRPDPESGVSIVLGITIHLAIRMGYHRDPHHFPEISPFEGELRRRLWAILIHMEVGFSAQMGTPRCVRMSISDTAEPRNLEDSDFDANTTELPPSRPETECNPMLSVLAKLRLTTICGEIFDHIASTTPLPYADIMKIDSRLQEVMRRIRAPCRMRPLTQSMKGSPVVASQRMLMEITYHQAQIVLHRKYLTPCKNQEKYSYSRKTVLEAAMEILRMQHMLDEVNQPGGVLHVARWRLLASLKQAYLLAASVLCFYLQQNKANIGSEELGDIQIILKKTESIWVRAGSASVDEKRGAKAIGVTLGNDVNQETAGSDISLGDPWTSSFDQPFSSFQDSDISFEPQFWFDPVIGCAQMGYPLYNGLDTFAQFGSASNVP